MIDRRLVTPRFTFFSGSPPAKIFGVYRALPEEILGWVADW
jgi:hypothetical protein